MLYSSTIIKKSTYGFSSEFVLATISWGSNGQFTGEMDQRSKYWNVHGITSAVKFLVSIELQKESAWLIVFRVTKMTPYWEGYWLSGDHFRQSLKNIGNTEKCAAYPSSLHMFYFHTSHLIFLVSWIVANGY